MIQNQILRKQSGTNEGFDHSGDANEMVGARKGIAQ
jgi:hypothetical protein